MPAEPRRTTLERQAVRLLPINQDHEVLLLQCIRPQEPDAPFWVTIGGGIEPGEDERAAGVRELWEETGIALDPGAPGRPAALRAGRVPLGAYDIVQHQRYYRAQVVDTTVSFANLEEVEVATTLGYRWWPLAELLATTEDVIDNQLAVITAALSGGH